MMVDLRPLTKADLPAVEPWFSDPDTRRYLGGPGMARADAARGPDPAPRNSWGSRQSGGPAAPRVATITLPGQPTGDLLTEAFSPAR
jgi:hypothetical protein